MASSEEQNMEQHFATSTIVKIFVGPKRKEFHVHKGILINASTFFEKCLNNKNFQEGQTGQIWLQEDDPEPFGIIVNWIYGLKLSESINLTKEVTYVNAYRMADRFMMIACKDAIMTAVQTLGLNLPIRAPRIEPLEICNLPCDSLLRKYYVDQYAWDLLYRTPLRLPPIGPEIDRKDVLLMLRGGEMIPELFQRVILWAQQGYRNIRNPSMQTECIYHEHRSGENCPDKSSK